ncbi:MAG: thiamine phosphate synthase [Betaproteobacteria bacterium]
MISDIYSAAQAIVSHHAATLGLPDWRPVEMAKTGEPTPIESAVRLACQRMGFDDVDAHVLAAAWQRQSLRLGHFDAAAWPSQPQDFGIAPWPRSQAFAPCPQALGLYVVLPDADGVGRMARAGVPTVQLRFKSDDSAAVQREVQAAVEAVRGTDALLFINDHWQAALQAGAYGVHLGQEDLMALPSADVQRLRESGIRLGLSTHGYAEMLSADRHSPSYLALGAVFPTTLKRMATAAQGTGRLQRYARLMADYPLVAIGGIDEERLPSVMATGVGSAAVVRAVVGAAQPEEAARALAAQLRALSLR